MIPVILAGGSGTRLWPLSQPSLPKPFLRLFSEHSLLQETLLRVQEVEFEAPIVVCNEEHRFVVAEQLRDMMLNQKAAILLEPLVRDTAPAIALAAFHALNASSDTDPVLLVLPADHRIEKVTAFHQALKRLLVHVENGGIGTLGICAHRAATEYGYIKTGHAVEEGVYRVDHFVEKPASLQAEQYLAAGDYYWNSGIFLVKASRFLEALQRYCPDMFSACQKASASAMQDLDFIRIDAAAFADCESRSIDYALLEPMSRAEPDAIFMAPLAAQWSDVGNWQSLAASLPQDVHGNTVIAHNADDHASVRFHQADNCLVAMHQREVVVAGVDNLVVVDTPDALLVAHKDQAHAIKSIVQDHSRSAHAPRVAYRPWGKYEIITQGSGYQVKRLTVKVGGRLSLQRHAQRAEHWIVVSGVARVTQGDKVFDVRENESTFIAMGQVHCLENPGTKPLELIEVQSGTYLGEDDIERFNDAYGRN